MGTICLIEGIEGSRTKGGGEARAENACRDGRALHKKDRAGGGRIGKFDVVANRYCKGMKY